MIGDNIRTQRKIAGLTQGRLAEKLHVPASLIGQYERGVRKPKLETLNRIADALQVPVSVLIDEPPAGYADKFKRDLTEYKILAFPMDSIKESYEKMNNAGRQEAARRIEQLSRLDEYKKKESVNANANDEETR